jgi:hypothetical protein
MTLVDRFIATLLVLAVALGGASAVVCDGWQPSPLARKACCARTHDGCRDQSASDACCAKSEQRQHVVAEQPGPVALPASTPAVHAIVAAVVHEADVPRSVAASAHHESARARPHDPPFLTSVLLI